MHIHQVRSNNSPWILLCLVVCSIVQVDSTSLMRRIRQQQTADDVLNKNLDLESEDWLHVPHSVQDVLMSIDDKLRGLDTLSYTLKLARLDFSLDQLVKRMESIETKLGRLETKFDLRMEKVEEVVVSKDIKEEFSNEHLSRRMEHLNEKINAKAAYLDAKLDFKLERIMKKLDLLDRDLHSSVDDILERIIRRDEHSSTFEAKIVKREEKYDALDKEVRDLSSFLKEKLHSSSASDSYLVALEDVRKSFQNATNKTETLLSKKILGNRDAILGVVKQANDKIDQLSENCQTYDSRVRSLSNSEVDDPNGGQTSTQQQLNNLTIMLEKAFKTGEAKLKELDTDVELYTKKVINGIQELWKSSDQVKSDLSNTLEQGSKTREMVRQEFQRLHEQIEPLPKIEPKLSHISEDLDKKVVELSTTVDNSFATILVAQNSFIASCRRIQDEETHVYDILQQIVYEMRNRSSEDIRRINDELQLQTIHINKSLSSVLDAVLMAGNSTTQAMRKLQYQLRHKVEDCPRTNDIALKLIDILCNAATTGIPQDTDTFDPKELEENVQMPQESVNTSVSKRGRKGNNLASNNNSSSLVPFDYDANYQFSDRDYE